ncbi:MAG: ABC transporter substrate-binding protein [Gemmatimonadaceae bacterium]|nr:ABC transporter substrate-binding protein [Gemmatimonadaceae bacterium]
MPARSLRPCPHRTVVTVAVWCLGFSACSKAPESSAARSVTIGALQPITTLDPRTAVLRAEIDVARLLHDGLVALDTLGHPVPSLARAWRTLDDGRTVRFALRTDRRFHSGAPVTARAVIRSLTPARTDRDILEGSTPLLTAIDGGAEYLDGRRDTIVGLRAVDDSTLDVVFRAAAPDLTTFAAVRHGIRGPTATRTAPDGSGPWRLARAESPTTHLVLARVAPRPGYPDTLHVRVVATSDIGAAFTRGALDCLPRAFATTRRLLASRPDLIVNDIGPWYMPMILLSPRQRLWDDERARRALSLAIDRVTYTATFAPRVGVAAAGLRSPLTDPTVRSRVPLPYDPARARALLDSVALSRSTPLRLAVVSNSPDDSVVGPQAALAASLHSVGVRTRFVVTDRPFKALQDGTVDLHLGGYSFDSQRDEPLIQLLTDRLLPDSIAGRHHLPPLASYEDALRTERDSTRRGRVLASVDSLMIDAMPLVPLWFAPGSTISRLGVTGCTMEGAQIDQFVLLRRVAP